jgi:DNA-directed RNA polymerase subunit beta
MKVKNFTKSKIHLNLPYLLEPQITNWKEFWDIDLKELFEEISPIRDYTKKEYELWFLDYKLGEPKYKDEFEAKENNDSYSAPLRAMVKLVDVRTKEEKVQEVYLADFPLMTERGTFIINGVERVVIANCYVHPEHFLQPERYMEKDILVEELFQAEEVG